MDLDTAGSTDRLGLAAAPGGLCIVQDLLNSASMPAASVPDLLADVATAQAWLDAAVQTWSRQTGRTPSRFTLLGDDLLVLSGLRRRVRGWLTEEAEDRGAPTLTAEVAFRDGRLTYEPHGDGAAAVTSLVLLEALLAAQTGTLGRLKTCMNPACGAAFYDLSRNSTRVWHDMKTCGNAINLRASRARRRKPTEPRPGPDASPAGLQSAPSTD